ERTGRTDLMAGSPRNPGIPRKRNNRRGPGSGVSGVSGVSDAPAPVAETVIERAQRAEDLTLPPPETTFVFLRRDGSFAPADLVDAEAQAARQAARAAGAQETDVDRDNARRFGRDPVTGRPNPSPYPGDPTYEPPREMVPWSESSAGDLSGYVPLTADISR